MTINNNDLSVTTTNGEVFSTEDHLRLALLIFKRWGKDPRAAASAWRRLLQNNCEDSRFMAMVNSAMGRGY